MACSACQDHPVHRVHPVNNGLRWLYIAIPREIRFFGAGLVGLAGCTARYAHVNVHLFRN